MDKLTRNDILDIIEYEKVRVQLRDQVIAMKQQRRVSVGPHITLVFENRETVLFQIEEMMRVERIVHDEQIQAELDVYNPLIPEKNELSASLFIEITEQSQIKRVLDGLLGIDHGEHLWLEFGENRVAAQFEAGRSSEIEISAVHFVRFKMTPQEVRSFRSGEGGVARLSVRHQAYVASVLLTPETRATLGQDLT